ncbi:hypothetical protein SK128_024682 [Halocaridina rubra]|uniref:Uncharacterized protein n=1 Tax=Halocaridina rubra TaxID=373956 RepID=A0AAN8WNS8_HALRR
MVRNYAQGAKWIPATVKSRAGPLSYKISTKEGQVMKCYQDQIWKGDPPSLERASSAPPGPEKLVVKPSTPLEPKSQTFLYLVVDDATSNPVVPKLFTTKDPFYLNDFFPGPQDIETSVNLTCCFNKLATNSSYQKTRLISAETYVN